APRVSTPCTVSLSWLAVEVLPPVFAAALAPLTASSHTYRPASVTVAGVAAAPIASDPTPDPGATVPWIETVLAACDPWSGATAPSPASSGNPPVNVFAPSSTSVPPPPLANDPGPLTVFVTVTTPLPVIPIPLLLLSVTGPVSVRSSAATMPSPLLNVNGLAT